MMLGATLLLMLMEWRLLMMVLVKDARHKPSCVGLFWTRFCQSVVPDAFLEKRQKAVRARNFRVSDFRELCGGSSCIWTWLTRPDSPL